MAKTNKKITRKKRTYREILEGCKHYKEGKTTTKVDSSLKVQPLTDELIIDLIKQNAWNEDQLTKLQSQGAMYCKERNSFFVTVEIVL